MLIYDVLHKEKVYQIVSGNLRSWGVKYRIKKNAVKLERNASALKKVFKTPLSYLPLDVVTLSSGAIIHVPVFVSQATTFLLQHVKEEGLFRKAGSQQRQREIITRLDSGGGLGDKSSPIDVANCLKTFLRSLPEPLIPHTYQDLFVRCHMLRTNKTEALLLACILLPPHHLNTLAYLMEFFKTVASHEKYNKMSIENIARVVGPNIMPLQETTMVAVQSRLDIHLSIVKILVENAEKIGVLPDDVSEAISMDSVGSMENELDHSDPSSFKNKRKKHRSGSLTRIMSGLKKMVGKNSSPNNTEVAESRLITCESTKSLHTPALPTGKKRKIEGVNSLNSNRQNGFRSYLEVMPCSSFGHINPQNSPVSNDPNPLKEKSPNQKTGVHRYLSHKIHSESKDHLQVERPKKHRLSLDRFVPRAKHRNVEKGTEERKKSFSPDAEQRWSVTSDLPDSKKRRRTESIDSCSPQSKLRNSGSENALQDVFMEADINLSDECGDRISQNQSGSKNEVHCRRASSTRKSTHSYSLRNCCSPNKADSLDLVECQSEEYVKVPKSEYEEIKSRVSAIESRISQEFKSIKSESGDVLTTNQITNVQNEYEKTLEEASIGDTVSADQLAKRLSRELKIRRSAEHKIIRSPSARKIGSLRRRSQDKPIRKIHRTVSWHSNRDRPSSILKTESRLNNSGGYCPKQCSLKRGRPLVKQNSYKNLSEQVQKSENHGSFCSDETNARLNYLQQQLNTLISHTAEHTRGSFSDDDFAPLDDDVFENGLLSNTETPIVEKSNLNTPAIRRTSSIHGVEFTDNPKYFNSRIEQLKRNSIQHSPSSGRSQCPGSATKAVEAKKEKTVSWKDADHYFQQEAKMLTPVPQTGRASVAKLRTQNAGMVLAKAKLFDDPTKEAVDVSRRQSMKLQLAARISTRDEPRASLGARRHASSGDVIVRRKTNSNRRSPISPIIRMAVTISSGSQRRQSSRFGNSRCSSQEEVVGSHRSQKENHLIRSNSEMIQPKTDVTMFKPGESPMCKTPLIKRPLSVKTPKSAKSLSARKSASVMNASRRTPLKAVLPITPRRQSPRTILKSTHLSRHPS
ncbi:hypothetical protein QAD02_001400 [Eretmocerus hayati]|uniref:Uncharacterized protein n=1 Tax=Eretmocerus hayati TaxID=131215 RepID=A0ACC2NGU3_9HYME|nr:hypothetical protein QAD02_001400 [Eretmocerus hayati]